MPYLIDFSTMKSTIQAYWDVQIEAQSWTSGQKTTAHTLVSTELDQVTTAETTYKDWNNSWANAGIRYRWARNFGFLTLAVLYRHCMTFPVSAGLPDVPWFIMPLNTGDDISLGDLRSICVAWRYSWPGDGMTVNPFFQFSGTTIIKKNAPDVATPEIDMMVAAFTQHYPYYSQRYSNTSTYQMGTENSTEILDIIDTTALHDRDKFGIHYHQGSNAHWEGRGILDRLHDFINAGGGFDNDHPTVPRYQAGIKIMNYITVGNEVTVTNKPKDWMLANGGQEVMDYFGWDDINGSIL